MNKTHSPEELDRRRALSRERNRRYLAKKSPEVAAARKRNSDAYRERLRADPAMAEKAAEIKRAAVERSKHWAKANPARVKELARAYRQRHPEREVGKVQRRNAVKLKAVPSWANFEAIARHYENARYLTEVSGHLHHVDHIIPLRGKTVCGLHVENNLRAIPHFLNTRKGNRLEA